MTKRRRKRPMAVGHIYIFAAVWAILAFVLPMYKLWAIVVTAVAASAACAVSRPIFEKRLAAGMPPEPEPEPEPEVSYGKEVDEIIAEGKRAQKEMGRLYASIHNTEIRQKINRIMQVSDKIVQDAVHDPKDVPQIRRFLNYYLPTTIKLLNAYDRMGSQGIQGENITGTMKSIEQMLDTAIAAYEKQLDSLFANQALDIETDIEVLNNMISREGLGGSDFKTGGSGGANS